MSDQGQPEDLLDQIAAEHQADLLDQVASESTSTPARAPASAPPEIQRLVSASRPWPASVPGTQSPAPQAVTPPKPSVPTASISSYKPSNWDRLKAAVPVIGEVADVVSGRKPASAPMPLKDVTQLLYPERVYTPTEQEAHPIRTGVDEFAGGLTSPENILLVQGLGALGILPGTAGRLIPRLASAGFSVQMVHDAIRQTPEALAAWNRGDKGEAERIGTHVVLNTLMAGLSARHAVKGDAGALVRSAADRPLAPSQEPTLPRQQPQSTVAPEVQNAAASMARAQQTEVMAQRVARGMPPVPVPPPAPAPPSNPEITAEIVQQVGEHIESLPKEQQAQAIVDAHGELANGLLQQGKVVTPDGTLHLVKGPDQADTLAAAIINNEVKRQDKVAEEKQPAKNNGEAMGAARMAAKAVVAAKPEAEPEPVTNSGVVNAPPETAAKEPPKVTSPDLLDKIAGEPKKGDRVRIADIETPATVGYMSDANGLKVLRVEFDEPTKVPWDSKLVTKANVPTKYQKSVEAFTEPEAEPKREDTPESLAKELVTSDSGQFEPDKIAAAAGKGTGAIGDYLRSEVEANKRARKLQSEMYDLESQHQGTVLRAVQAMERTGKEYGKNLAADSEAVYHHLENPEGHDLTPEQDNLLDNHVLPVMEDTNTKFARLKELLGQDANLVGNYVHRVVKDKGDWLDRAVAGQKGGTGRGNLLSKSAPQTKGRTMMALEDENGTRRVVSVKGGEVTAWDAGQSEKLGKIGTESQNIREQVAKINQRVQKLEDERRTLLATPSRVKVTFERRKNITEEIDQLERDHDRIENSIPPGELDDRVFVDDAGKHWKVTQATTKEIEANTGLKYYHNALASALVSNIQITKALRGAEFVESFKNSPEFKDIAFHRGDGNPPDKWKPTELPQLRDYYFEPHTAEVLNWFAERIKGHDPSAYDQIGNFLRTSIFFNPLIHTPNIAVHWAVEKGLRGYMPDRWLASYRAGVKAINAVTHQNQDFLEALDAGAPLQSQREDVAKVTQLFFESLTKGLKSEEPWATRLAKQVGMAPVDLVKGIYRFSGKATWTTNDVAFLQAAYEKVEQGMPLKQALTETAKHIPDYRLPTRILNSTTIAKVMSNPALTMFGQYHYGALRSYGEMAKSALGISDVPGRSKAAEVGHGWEMLAALGLVTFVVYPMIDRALQEATGNKNARLRRAGAATFPWNIQQLAKHEKTPTEVLEATATPAIHTKTGIEVITNHNWRTGREIRDPLADWHTQAQQVGRHLAEAISPVGAASRWAEGGPEARKRLAYGFLGVSFAKTHAEKLASDIAAKKMGVEAETPEQRAAYSRRSEILEALRKGDDKPLSQALSERQINSEQARELRRRARLTPLQDKVRNFRYRELWQVYEAADPDEKKQLEHTLRRKRAELFEKSRGEEVGETEVQQ